VQHLALAALVLDERSVAIQHLQHRQGLAIQDTCISESSVVHLAGGCAPGYTIHLPPSVSDLSTFAFVFGNGARFPLALLIAVL
jgi:hypothetical protein